MHLQLVEDEEIIGTLIDANERIIAALQSYDKLSNPNVTEKDVKEVQQGLEAVQISGSEVQKLQEKQRAAVLRAVRQRPRTEDDAPSPSSPVHPDLQDLSFGELGPEDRNLPPPIRPTTQSSYDHREYSQGSLSDYSDYESSDGATYRGAGESSRSQVRKTYINVSDNEEERGAERHIVDDEDPFADPFGD